MTVFNNNDKTWQLVELCKQGNRKAQQEVYSLYAKAMFNTALRIVSVREEAEDVLQEAFLDCFLKINSFRGESTLGAWLKTIVVNKAIAKLRSRKAIFEDIENHSVDLKEEVSEEDFEGKIEMVEKIKRTLNQLPAGFRLVLSLYLFDGYDHQEIGSILGISEITSRSQYIRGKARLLELLKN